MVVRKTNSAKNDPLPDCHEFSDGQIAVHHSLATLTNNPMLVCCCLQDWTFISYIQVLHYVQKRWHNMMLQILAAVDAAHCARRRGIVGIPSVHEVGAELQLMSPSDGTQKVLPPAIEPVCALQRLPSSGGYNQIRFEAVRYNSLSVAAQAHWLCLSGSTGTLVEVAGSQQVKFDWLQLTLVILPDASACKALRPASHASPLTLGSMFATSSTAAAISCLHHRMSSLSCTV